MSQPDARPKRVQVCDKRTVLDLVFRLTNELLLQNAKQESMVKTAPVIVASVKLVESVANQMVLVLMVVRMVTKNLSVWQVNCSLFLDYDHMYRAESICVIICFKTI